MTAAELVKALGGRGSMARRPVHKDHTPSLPKISARCMPPGSSTRLRIRTATHRAHAALTSPHPERKYHEDN